VARLRFAVVNEVVTDRSGWFDHVRRVEQSGIDTLLVRDHLAVEPFGPQLAPLAMLSAAAVTTTRAREPTPSPKGSCSPSAARSAHLRRPATCATS
jgi:hypothetical protein